VQLEVLQAGAHCGVTWAVWREAKEFVAVLHPSDHPGLPISGD
jgi:hypothetical protein